MLSQSTIDLESPKTRPMLLFFMGNPKKIPQSHKPSIGVGPNTHSHSKIELMIMLEFNDHPNTEATIFLCSIEKSRHHQAITNQL